MGFTRMFIFSNSSATFLLCGGAHPCALPYASARGKGPTSGSGKPLGAPRRDFFAHIDSPRTSRRVKALFLYIISTYGYGMCTGWLSSWKAPLTKHSILRSA